MLIQFAIEEVPTYTPQQQQETDTVGDKSKTKTLLVTTTIHDQSVHFS